MKCDTKTMIKTAIGMGLLGVIGYFALPQFRSFIVGISPFLLALACPLSMIIMMKGMNSHQKEQEKKQDLNSEPTKVPAPTKEEETDNEVSPTRGARVIAKTQQTAETT